MKIAYTSDIHIDSSKENAMIPQEILYQLKKNTPDVFIITGDISHSLKIIEQTLSAFRALSCMKLFVPGNHDIWIETDCPNSYTKYFKILPRVAKENGFIPIWIEPYILDTYGFCGSMGWYDYSFRDRNLNLPEEVYAEKRYKGHTWMDREYARFIIKEKLLTDKEITQLLYTDFTKQYDKTSKKADKIIALFHHIPFREMIRYRQFNVWNFFATYMGSKCFGDFLLGKKEIELVIYGHSHQKQKKKITGQGRTRPITVVSSPFGYFNTEGIHPVHLWYTKRLSFIEV